jgi:RNA polymerase primary sigma factor
MFNGKLIGFDRNRATGYGSLPVSRQAQNRRARIESKQRPLASRGSRSVRDQRLEGVWGTPEPQVEDPIPLPAEQATAPGSAPGYVSALSSFMRDIGAVPLLTPEEEITLAARIKRGDVAARERMIRANLRLVVKIARDYDYLGLPLLDLISEGAIGLMKAVDKFDPSKGGKLSTYASWWIKQQIRRGLANQGRTIRLPVHVEAKIYKLGLVESRLRGVLGRDATDEELASELESNPKRVARLRDAALRPASLEIPLGEEGSSTLAEVIGDDRGRTPYEHFESKNDQALLVRLIHRLPKREAEILRCRFGLDGREEETLEEVGRKYGLTRERIRQLQNEAFKKLRELMENSAADAIRA